MDASIGVIMQKLRDVGLENNTFVIFTRYGQREAPDVDASAEECAIGQSPRMWAARNYENIKENFERRS